MRKTGKIALWAILGLVLAAVAMTWVSEVKANTKYTSRTLVVPFGGEANLTVVFRQDKTGNILHATTGDCSASVTFANGRITAARHPQSGDWLVAIPATDIKTLYGTLYYAAAATVSKDTAPDVPGADAFLFDMKIGASFSDTSPMLNGRVLVE